MRSGMMRVTRPVAIDTGQSPRRKNSFRGIAPMHRKDMTLAAIRITFLVGMTKYPTSFRYIAEDGFGICSKTSRLSECHLSHELLLFVIDMCTVNRWVGILEEIKSQVGRHKFNFTVFPFQNDKYDIEGEGVEVEVRRIEIGFVERIDGIVNDFNQTGRKLRREGEEVVWIETEINSMVGLRDFRLDRIIVIGTDHFEFYFAVG
jgi:hypothetical protein